MQHYGAKEPAESFRPNFPPACVRFLRALKRNNDREWFRARKDDYERHVRGPALAIIDRLAQDLREFAPDLVASPRSLFRPYRDTRFSADKRPLKTHVAAQFPHRGLPRHGGAGLYFHVALDGVWAGGGFYAPQPAELVRLREHLAENVDRLRAIVEAPRFKKVAGGLQGERLTRVPRGFPSDHPAAEYLKYRQLYAGAEFPVAFASSPKFYGELLKVFQTVAPLVHFLNEPLVGRSGDSTFRR